MGRQFALPGTSHPVAFHCDNIRIAESLPWSKTYAEYSTLFLSLLHVGSKFARPGRHDA